VPLPVVVLIEGEQNIVEPPSGGAMPAGTHTSLLTTKLGLVTAAGTARLPAHGQGDAGRPF